MEDMSDPMLLDFSMDDVFLYDSSSYVDGDNQILDGAIQDGCSWGQDQQTGNCSNVDVMNLSFITTFDELPEQLPASVQNIFVVTYVIIITLAVIGNLTVILMIATNRKMRTVTNAFLVSLAVSDTLIATLNMPFQLRFHLQNEWTMGEATCKFTNYVQGVVVVTSIFTLIGIASDRYYAICYPLHARYLHTVSRALALICTFWLISLLLLVPQVFIQRLEPYLVMHFDTPSNQSTTRLHSVRVAEVCVEYFPDYRLNVGYTMFFYVVVYLLPVLLMFLAYGRIVRTLWRPVPLSASVGFYGASSIQMMAERKRLREKKRVVRMLVLIVVLFTVSWFPFYTGQVYMLFDGEAHQRFRFRIRMACFQLIAYSNCCINPAVYCLLNDSFRQRIGKVFSSVIAGKSLKILRRKSTLTDTFRLHSSARSANGTRGKVCTPTMMSATNHLFSFNATEFCSSPVEFDYCNNRMNFFATEKAITEETASEARPTVLKFTSFRRPKSESSEKKINGIKQDEGLDQVRPMSGSINKSDDEIPKFDLDQLEKEMTHHHEEQTKSSTIDGINAVKSYHDPENCDTPCDLAHLLHDTTNFDQHDHNPNQAPNQRHQPEMSNEYHDSHDLRNHDQHNCNQNQTDCDHIIEDLTDHDHSDKVQINPDACNHSRTNSDQDDKDQNDHNQMNHDQKTHDQADSNSMEQDTFDHHQKDHDQIDHDHVDHDQINHDHVDHDQINHDCVDHDQTMNDHIDQEHHRGIHLDHSSGQESLMLQGRMFISSCIELSASDFRSDGKQFKRQEGHGRHGCHEESNRPGASPSSSSMYFNRSTPSIHTSPCTAD